MTWISDIWMSSHRIMSVTLYWLRYQKAAANTRPRKTLGPISLRRSMVNLRESPSAPISDHQSVSHRPSPRFPRGRDSFDYRKEPPCNPTFHFPFTFCHLIKPCVFFSCISITRRCWPWGTYQGYYGPSGSWWLRDCFETVLPCSVSQFLQQIAQNLPLPPWRSG